MSTFIETERLVIRSLTEGDAIPLASLWADPRVTEFMGGPRDFEKISASFRERIQSKDESDYMLRPVVERTSGNVIGHCGLLRKEVDGVQETELVYVIAFDAWNHGYATEAAAAIRDHAFASLGCERLIALIDPENVASGRVALKIGMRPEKETVRPGGKLMRVYGLQRETQGPDEKSGV